MSLKWRERTLDQRMSETRETGHRKSKFAISEYCKRCQVISEKCAKYFLFMAGKNISTTRDSVVWFIDSGATQHMTSLKKFMSNFKIISPSDIHLTD